MGQQVLPPWVCVIFGKYRKAGYDADGITIDICPDISTVAYPHGDLEEVRSYFYLQEGQYKFNRGMARAHDMLWVFTSSEADAANKLDQFSAPPLVRIDPNC